MLHPFFIWVWSDASNIDPPTATMSSALDIEETSISMITWGSWINSLHRYMFGETKNPFMENLKTVQKHPSGEKIGDRSTFRYSSGIQETLANAAALRSPVIHCPYFSSSCPAYCFPAYWWAQDHLIGYLTWYRCWYVLLWKLYFNDMYHPLFGNSFLWKLRNKYLNFEYRLKAVISSSSTTPPNKMPCNIVRCGCNIDGLT